MDAIMAIAARHGAGRDRGQRARPAARPIRDRPLGTLGRSGDAVSFHETKNVHCGEGGALLINDAELAERAEILREKGTNRSRFFRGQVDKYTWVDLGSSYLPSRTPGRVPRRAARGRSTRSRSDGCWCGSGIAGALEPGHRAGFSFQHCPDDREHPAHIVRPPGSGPRRAPAVHRPPDSRLASRLCSTTCRCTVHRWACRSASATSP